ncbi:MAG TPA: biotin/lipoyl-containing protein [Anaerolineales bacterium]|nr:biotin/lipoyl-containing protein [Anaerolineales bacterium]
MNSPIPVTTPLLNPNEPEASLAALHVQNGQHVTTGDPLFTLETTKSAADVQAEEAGYVTGIQVHIGDTVQAGEILCYLADSPEWTPAEPAVQLTPQTDQPVPEGLRITHPALELARQSLVDLSQLPRDQLITETTLRAYLTPHSGEKTEYSLPPTSVDSTAVIIYGGGGHAKALIDVIRAMGVYRIAGVLDDNPSVQGEILGVPVLGGAE